MKGIDQNGLDELLRLLTLGQQIAELDLDKLADEKLRKLSEKERLIHDLLEKDSELPKRIASARTGNGRKPKPKLHWKTRQKKEREYNRMVRTPRARERKAQMLKERGWYPVLLPSWKTHGLEVELTEQEWNDVVAPLVKGMAPIVHRYDATGPISLANIWIENKHRKVLFDGMEYKMKSLGYLLED